MTHKPEPSLSPQEITATRVSPRWEAPGAVAGFLSSPPNAVLMEYARALRERLGRQAQALDIGGGAGRNALPLATLGFDVVCADLSEPMLEGAAKKIAAQQTPPSVRLVHAPMAPLPLADDSFDLVVAHGIWNLARSGAEFRAAVREAARVARPGASLFLFTFARHTIAPTDAPVPGETFVFTQFNGEPACFLTEEEILSELGAAGFVRDTPGPLTVYNLSRTPRTITAGPPVIYEGTFRREAAP